MALRFRTDPLVSTGLRLARAWCQGHQIDGAPALGHGVRVATCLGRHVPSATPELIAAALVHDGPEFAPLAGVEDVYGVITAELSAGVARVVRALADEHQALDAAGEAEPPLGDVPTLLASTADKAVSLESVLNRGLSREIDPAEYWRTRGAFLAAVPYFRVFHSKAAGVVPRPLADALHVMVMRAELVACRYAPGSPSLSSARMR
ncbi:HD domain-containing protein [Actinomadura montaniterrae]|uniref:HD domain-containing protein n=1 Tax=Actinomadura montaniterrae TaxID=1803903 RepID=A0A6L3VUN4_9ACTN|nr:HD domain-containing protein [Actinomadura montaniterrae]KAB2376975.1 HD domain-containing protein [Actinomadura montaniterrae]